MSDVLSRIFELPLSKFGRRLVLAEVLGEPVSRRNRRGRGRPSPRAPEPAAPQTPPPEPAKGT